MHASNTALGKAECSKLEKSTEQCLECIAKYIAKICNSVPHWTTRSKHLKLMKTDRCHTSLNVRCYLLHQHQHADSISPLWTASDALLEIERLDQHQVLQTSHQTTTPGLAYSFGFWLNDPDHGRRCERRSPIVQPSTRPGIEDPPGWQSEIFPTVPTSHTSLYKVEETNTEDVTKTGNGEWGMGNGEWGMGNGKLKMGNKKI